MTGIKLVENICKIPGYENSLGFYTKILKEVLKLGKKDLRAAPLVRIILESMLGKTQEQILKALEVTKEKSKDIEGKVLSPNYFITVLKNQIDRNQKYAFNNENVILQWGRPI